MIKLIDLLNEIDIPKNKWTTIPSSELKDYDDEIFNLISTAYAPIGGHPNYKSPDNITGREADAEYEVIDLDDDPEIDAISVTKSKPSGKKFTATGHDNSKPAKSKVVNHKADLLKSLMDGCGQYRHQQYCDADTRHGHPPLGLRRLNPLLSQQFP